MGNFSTATTLRPRAAAEGFDVELDGQWSLADKPNGGYLLAILGRAAAAVAGDGYPHVTAISGSFIQVPDLGHAVVTVEALRAGRGSAQLRARLTQKDRPCVEALITLGVLTGEDSWWSGLEPVDLPPLEDCPRSAAVGPGGAFKIPLLEVIDQHLDPACGTFRQGKPSGKGEMAGWLRLADGADWEPLSLLVALDALPPVSYNVGVPGWAPTVQFSAYLRRLPAPGPVKMRMTAHDLGGDRMDEAAFLWDTKNRLVAQATQIAAVRLEK